MTSCGSVRRYRVEVYAGKDGIVFAATTVFTPASASASASAYRSLASAERLPSDIAIASVVSRFRAGSFPLRFSTGLATRDSA
jgi:hypothetical protein